MELWIRSQDKERLLKLNDIFVNANYCIEDGETYGYRIFTNDELYLGTYNSKKRALEVLDEIQNELKFFDDLGNKTIIIYEMPEDVLSV